MAEDAIERNLQIIGEAANHPPAEITARDRRDPRSAASGTSSSTNTSGSTL